MKGAILLCIAVMTLLSGCIQPENADTESVSRPSSSTIFTPPYFSFAEYGEMTKSCDKQAISERFRSLDTPDLPSIPYKEVRLCEPDLLVLALQSMTASHEFLLVAPEKQWFARVQVTSAGSVCSGNDGCDQVTDRECDVQKGCTHFRSIELEDMARTPVVFATLRTAEEVKITNDDFLAIAAHRDRLFFHRGNAAYRHVTGILATLAPGSTGALLFDREEEGSNAAMLLRPEGEVIMDASPITEAERGIYGFTYDKFFLSASGRFALFRALGWEASQALFYDIERKKITLLLNDAHDIGMTPDETTAYGCASSQLSGEIYGRLYRIANGTAYFSFLDLPEMQQIPMANSFIREVNCTYDGERSMVKFCATYQRNTDPDMTEQTVCLYVDPVTERIVQE